MLVSQKGGICDIEIGPDFIEGDLTDPADRDQLVYGSPGLALDNALGHLWVMYGIASSCSKVALLMSSGLRVDGPD
jgi:hypothetical protein